MVYVHTHNIRISIGGIMRVSNVSVPHEVVAQSKELKNLTIIDSQSIYQVLYIANKMFPGGWDRHKSQFGIYLNASGMPVFGGMGLEKSLVRSQTSNIKLDYSIFGRAFPYLTQYSKLHQQCVFIMPGDQKVPGTHKVGSIADLDLSQVSSKMFTPRDKNFDFTLRHNLIEAAKVQFESLIEEHINKTVVDPKDLLYQCLFQLVSMAPMEYLDRPTVVRDYGGVLYDELAPGAKFIKDVLQSIVYEQYQVLRNEYYDKERELFNQLSGRLLNKGKLKLLNGKPHLVLNGRATKLEIRQVPVELATRIHGSFHYIHTPRTNGYTLGLFVEGDSLPLSVIAVEKVDRLYKRAALSRYGIDHNHTYELTRMYS